MRRLWLLGVLTAMVAVACLTGLSGSGLALAAVDDNIPGVPLAMGASISGTVTADDVADVYALTLAEGQEVHFRCDPGTVDGRRGVFHLLVPGASTVNDVAGHDEVAYTLRSGSPERYWADFDYIPARSGTYYLWVEWEAGALEYELSAARTSRAALALAPDADDVPGVSAGSGSLTGVVSTLADPDDVYAVGMTAGRPVTIRLTPLMPYHNNADSLAYLNLLDPDAPSLAARFGHVLAGLVPAKNSKDSASRQTAEIKYVPTQTGVYYVWVQAGSILHRYNFAYRLSFSGEEPPAPAFPDVPAGHPYETAINDLASRGIIGGYGAPTYNFGLLDSVKRAQFAKMIVGTLDIPPNASTVTRFTDLDAPDAKGYPHIYVQAAYDNGITNGTNLAQTLFAPWKPIQRDQVVSMIVRGVQHLFPGTLLTPPAGTPTYFAGVPDPHGANLRTAQYNGLLDGLIGLGPSWSVTANATRGEVAQMLHNLLGVLP